MKILRAPTWILWCMIIIAVITFQSVAIEDYVRNDDRNNNLGFTTVTFDLTKVISDKSIYDNFLNNLRNSVAASTRPCNIASTIQNPPTNARYVLVKLQHSSTQWITLGIDASSFYVWAYQDVYAGKTRATFLSDAPQAAKDALFPGSTKRDAPFGGSYISLERAAGTSRRTIPLTFEGLQGDINAIYGKSPPKPGQPEAKFFLRAIQIVSEAARFRFIQKAIRQNTTDDIDFRKKLVAYETNWDPISKAIHRAVPKCQEISPTLVISSTEVDFRKEVNNVNEIRDDMGLLKFKDSSSLINIGGSTTYSLVDE